MRDESSLAISKACWWKSVTQWVDSLIFVK